VLLAASTPGYSESPMTYVSNAMLEGEYVCRTIDFDFTCPECKEAQKDDPRIVCKCRAHLRPHIYNKRAIDISRVIFEDKDAFEKEIMGSQTTGLVPLNDPEKVRMIMESKYFSLNYENNQPPRVYISIDPNGGSLQKEKDTNSDYAFMGFINVNGKIWVNYIYICIFILFVLWWSF